MPFPPIAPNPRATTSSADVDFLSQKSPSHRLTARLLSASGAVAIAMAALAMTGIALPAPLSAQGQATDAELEDLIPDSAVDNPQGWASDSSDPGGDTPEEEFGADGADLDPETPLADLPDLAVEWPDDLELPPLDIDLPEEDIQFADLEIAGPEVAFTEADLVRLNDSLTLGFPQLDPPFTERGDFVERFEALSTIEELDGDDENIAQLAARAREDEELLAELLRVYGFYDGRIARSIGTSGAAGGADNANPPRPTVRFDVIPGQRYRFGAIDLGALGTARDADVLRRAFEIQPGDPMQSDRIETERFDLDTALGEFGYAFATIDEPQLLIDHDRDEGDLTMPVTPGGKYVFGAVTSSDENFLPGNHLATIARFDPGDIYQRSLELDLRRAITATGLVSSVTITPREVSAPVGDEPGVVAMDVGIERADLRTIAGAIGYGSEEGFRLAASWEHRNLFPPEGALKVRGILGTQEQLFGVGLRKNNFGGRDRILSLDAYASTIDSPAFDANTAGLVATYERRSTLLFQKPVSWSAGVELVATDERPPAVGGVAAPRSTYLVAAIPGYILLDSTDDLLDPTEGFRVSANLSPEVSRNRGTQSFYLRARTDASTYKQVTDKVVIAARAAFGAIPGTDLANIAPSRRYYAGGGGSVRGYGFRQIGPRDTLGDPSGGRSVVEGAVEARIRTGFFDGAVSVVPFLDAGSVSQDVIPDFDEIKLGVGVGLRYHTGFGPLRLDVGVPLNPGPDDSPVAVYVSLGQAF